MVKMLVKLIFFVLLTYIDFFMFWPTLWIILVFIPINIWLVESLCKNNIEENKDI